MSILQIIGLWVLLNFIILVHEVGHALTAHLLDVRVKKIQLGVPALYTFKVFELPVSIGLIPLIGFAQVESANIHWLKKLLIGIAGPASSFLFALVCYIAMGGSELVTSFASEWFYVIPVIKSFIYDTPSPIFTMVNQSDYSLIQKGLMLTGNINLSLAILNMLPVPFLDGGRVLFALLEGVFGEWANKAQEFLIPISFVVFMLWSIFR